MTDHARSVVAERHPHTPDTALCQRIGAHRGSQRHAADECPVGDRA